MNKFKLHLYVPGLDGSGVPAQGQFEGGHLRITAEGVDLRVALDSVSAKAAGFDGRQWLLEWASAEGPCSALLSGTAEVEKLLAAAPADFAASLQGAGRTARGRERRFGLGVGVVGLILALPLLLLFVFWLNAGKIAAWAAGHVTLEQEQQLGAMAFAQMQPQLKLVHKGPALDMVREIGGRLTAGSRYEYRWHVADDPQVNAFAVPGGYVVVYTGLIQAAASPEEVAGVLAHEVQHVEQRHSLQNLLHALGWRAILSLALGDLAGGVWTDVADELGGLKFGRDLEREADLEGLKALKRAGIAPEGMASFFENLAKQDGAALAWLSSHPASAERQEAIRAAIAEQGASASVPLPYDLKAIQAGL